MAATKKKDTTPHVPTDKSKGEVVALVSFGNTQEQIAEHLGISVDTLSRHYRDEITNSVVRANAKVATRLFRKATDGDDLTAMMFWLKTRARWRETDPIEQLKQDNERVKAELQEIRDQLNKKNKKEY